VPNRVDDIGCSIDDLIAVPTSWNGCARPVWSMGVKAARS